MRNFLMLLCIMPYLAIAQELPKALMDRFSELEALQQHSPTGSPDEYLLRATHDASWNDNISEWVHADSSEYYYNEFGEFEEIIHLNWNGNIWVNRNRVLHAYAMDTLRTGSITQTWDGTEWVYAEGDTRNDIMYDDSGNETSIETSFWNGSGWLLSSGRYTSYFSGTSLPETILFKREVGSGEALVNDELRTYELYNNNGAPVVYYRQSWNEAVDGWNLPIRYTFMYNSDGNVQQSVYEQQLADDEWLPLQLLSYTYDEEGKEVERLIQSYDGESWQDMTRNRYEYDDSGQLIMTIVENMEQSTGLWVIEWRVTTEYDENGNRTYLLYELGSDGEVENFLDRTTTYYEDIQQRATEKERIWMQGQWVNRDSTTFYYQLFTDTEERPLVQEGALEVFPNPAQGQFNLKIAAADLQGDGIIGTLYNTTGKVVRQYLLGQEFEQLSLSGLPSGTYWLKVSNGVQFAVQAVVVK